MVAERIALQGCVISISPWRLTEQLVCLFPPTTEEEEFDLFGPGPAATAPASSSTPAENPFQSLQQATAKASPAGSPTGVNVNPFAVPPQAAASVPTAGSTPGPQPSQGEEFQSIMLEMLRQQNQSTMELLRQQSLAMQQNQQMVAAMLRRMDLEEERRTKAEEKVVEAAEAARKAAETALTRDPFDPKEAASAKGLSQCAFHDKLWRFQQSREVSAPSSCDRPPRNGERSHEGGGDVACLYGNFEFLACATGGSFCERTAALHSCQDGD